MLASMQIGDDFRKAREAFGRVSPVYYVKTGEIPSKSNWTFGFQRFAFHFLRYCIIVLL